VLPPEAAAEMVPGSSKTPPSLRKGEFFLTLYSSSSGCGVAASSVEESSESASFERTRRSDLLDVFLDFVDVALPETVPPFCCLDPLAFVLPFLFPSDDWMYSTNSSTSCFKIQIIQPNS